MNNEKSTTNSVNNYALKNLNNYYSVFEYSSEDAMNKYYDLITEYLNVITEHKTIPLKNDEIYKFILFRGITTVSHVFYFILFYSKNLNMAYYHAAKSFYIYIEFIEQIMDDHHHFLNLYSRDAVFFVYKKTIHEIPNQVMKQNARPKINDSDVNAKSLFTPVQNSSNNFALLINEISRQMEVIEYFCYLLLNEENEKVSKKFVFQVKDIFKKITDTQYKKKLVIEIIQFFTKNKFSEIYFSQISREKKQEQINNKTEIICYFFDCFVNRISKMKVFDNSKKEKLLNKTIKITDTISTPEDYIHFLFS